MDIEVGDVRGEGTGLFPCKPSELFTRAGCLVKNSESSVTISLTATPSSNLNMQVGSFRDEQEVREFP